MKQPKHESETPKVEEAAAILGIGRQTAYDLARKSQLPGARRLGKRIVVSRRALDAFLEAEQRCEAECNHRHGAPSTT